MQTLYDTWFNISNTVIDVPNVIASMALQPMSRTITEKAKAKGGVCIPETTPPRYLPKPSLTTCFTIGPAQFPPRTRLPNLRIRLLLRRLRKRQQDRRCDQEPLQRNEPRHFRFNRAGQAA